MNTKTYSTEFLVQSRYFFLVVLLPLLAGFFLSIISWLQICVEHCSATKDYRFFNIPLALIGIVFFISAILFHLFSKRNETCGRVAAWIVASGLGAEVMLIAVQKYQIGRWCPICLSIAFSLVVAGSGMLAANLYSISKQKNRNPIMTSQFKKKAIFNTSFFFIGFLLAFIGIAKPDQAQAATDKMKERLEFGNKSSPIKVYFVSDWFCPSCKKIEPIIEKVYPEIQSKVGFFFIDFPIHTKSQNYSPYNLAFMVNSKPQYIAARNMLLNMTNEIESPTDEDIEAGAKKIGVHFKELSYVDVKNGMNVFDDVVDKYNLDSTPTIIILNTKTEKFKKLEGSEEISEEKILKAIEELNRDKSMNH